MVSVSVPRPLGLRLWGRLTCALMVLSLAIAWMTTSASAHASNENYVWVNLEENGLSGRFEIAFKELRERLGLDLPEEEAALDAALQDTAAQVQDYIRNNFEFWHDGAPVAFEFGDVVRAPGAEWRFVAYEFVTEPVDIRDRVELRNNLLLSWETPLYRSLAVVEYDRRRGVEYPMDYAVLAFGPNSRDQILDFANLSPVLTPGEFVWQGIIHVLAGPDHVLFLLGLLMTSVLVLRPVRQWQPVASFVPALWNAVVIVTLFALAHSVTLALTVLGIIQPNIQLIETLIALSIVAVALNNLFPVIDAGRWVLIVFFGLFHGMGFASAMSDLQFRLVEPMKVLVNFNIGLEIGQLIILLIVLPVLYAIRTTRAFQPYIFWSVNIGIALIAGYWTVSRGLGL